MCVTLPAGIPSKSDIIANPRPGYRVDTLVVSGAEVSFADEMRTRTRPHPAADLLTRHIELRMRGHRLRFRIGLLIGLLAATLVAPDVARARDEPCQTSDACANSLRLASGGAVPLYRTHALTSDPEIERAVIVIHGNRRDPDRYFEALIAAARTESRLANTLLLAPHFQTAKDEPARGQHYWSSSGWKIGNRSRDAARISSFAVLDELLKTICPNDPKSLSILKKIVIVGHSAGGQFVQRYAAGGAGCANSSVEVRYVVMNPSSYLYPDGRRRADGEGPFRNHQFGCWEYDDYKYGLRDLNAYMKAVGEARLLARLFGRSVYYLAGEDDLRLDSSSLDKSCEGNLQGPQRLARHQNYRDYSKLFEDWRGSVFLTIPSIGHQGEKMLKSETARRILFR
jgi:pimeloyl-ACP methyl ester carboxylesterase